MLSVVNVKFVLTYSTQLPKVSTLLLSIRTLVLRLLLSQVITVLLPVLLLLVVNVLPVVLVISQLPLVSKLLLWVSINVLLSLLSQDQTV